jgi:RNA:NAD 2'-phosphotransferase (TPT1/KptA family)
MTFSIVRPFFLLTFEICLCSCRTPSRYRIEAFQQWWRSRASSFDSARRGHHRSCRLQTLVTSSPTPGTAEAATEGMPEGGLMKFSRATVRLSMSEIRAKRGWSQPSPPPSPIQTEVYRTKDECPPSPRPTLVPLIFQFVTPNGPPSTLDWGGLFRLVYDSDENI